MSHSFIENIYSEKRVFSLAEQRGFHPHLGSLKEYQAMYRRSLEDPEGFWGELAQELFWYRPWQRVLSGDWKTELVPQWFQGAQTNMAVNCLDRHVGGSGPHGAQGGEQIALIWEGNDPGEVRRFSYRELHDAVGRLANGLKALGVKRGDRVAIYLGMVPELTMSLLACARIGAVHNVIFGGFSHESLRERIVDSGAEYLLTADALYRGDKIVPLKQQADQAMRLAQEEGHRVKACLVLRRTGEEISMYPKRDYDWEQWVSGQSPQCEAEVMEAEDPLFILYTSGSTGKPKGVLHSTAGYMVFVSTTFRYVFAYRPGEIFWCTADVGWITGHSYLVYGPLLNGATVLMYEGVPQYPHPDRFWEMIERHRVNIFYTAPTVIRALMGADPQWIRNHDLSSLKLLGTVGEPINPEAWVWYFHTIGQGRCPIVDTWWQTETGGIMVTTLPGIMPMKPGAAGVPFFGVKAEILNDEGGTVSGRDGGYFVLEAPWPAMTRGVYGQAERLRETYFSKFPGHYYSGDGAHRDEENYLWFLGRLDDVLNVSGHRLGTAELESAFVKHPKVVEAAVVGFPHKIKGQGIYAFLTLKSGIMPHRSLRRELIQHIAEEIGPIAKPDHIQFAPALPKTRSGKIMRRILRKVASGDVQSLGDISTLADPSVVETLLADAKAEQVEDTVRLPDPLKKK